jgi:hypothetical protein
MKPGFRGLERDAGRLRDVGQLHAEEGVHDDHRPAFRVETPELPLERGAVGRDEHGFGAFDLASLLATPDIDARPDDDATEPAIESTRIAQSRQFLPHADEALLDSIARQLSVTQDEPGGCIEPEDMRASERLERVVVASLGFVDEVAPVHVRLWLDAAIAASGW